jgi:hypothetical protein
VGQQVQRTFSSWIGFEASQRRVLPTTSRGRTVASKARACCADKSLSTPPGGGMEQQVAQPGRYLSAGAAELVTMVDQ